MRKEAIRSGLALLALFGPAGCRTMPADEVPAGPTHAQAALRTSAIAPLAEVNVRGKGAVAMEEDYLPRVVCCENAAAPSEALKAQAVMARTYVYFRYHDERLGTPAKPLTGTTADQAYFCKNAVTDACRRAVRVTAGQIASFTGPDDAIPELPETYASVGFFIDGPVPACVADRACACARPAAAGTSMTLDAHPPACDCFAFESQGRASAKYLTFNWSRSGADVETTGLGNRLHGSNRGCASQNIESCLAYAGWRYHDLLRFFYGHDVELRTVDGMPVAPEAEDASLLGTHADDPPDPACSPRRIGRSAHKKRDAKIAAAATLSALVVVGALFWRRRRRRVRAEDS